MKKELEIIYNDIVKPTGKVAYRTMSSFFALPSGIREIKNNSYDGSIIVPRVIGSAFGFYGLVINIPIYMNLYLKGNTEDIGITNNNIIYFFSATFTTNLASGVYEIWRYAKDKAKSPIIPMTSPTTSLVSNSGLEKKVEEVKPQIKVDEQTPKQIPNPWDVEIDEIGQISYGGKNVY